MKNINTKDYLDATSHKGPLAPWWEDKPHRLVMDLVREVERLRTVLKLTEFGFNSVRCNVCGGWDGKSENDGVHWKDCPVGLALTGGQEKGAA